MARFKSDAQRRSDGLRTPYGGGNIAFEWTRPLPDVCPNNDDRSPPVEAGSWEVVAVRAAITEKR